jgi:hypothetical protein
MPYLPSRDSGSTYQCLAKTNYQNLPPSNPLTDWDNTLLAPAICNIAGLGLTAPRITLRVQLAASTGGLSVITWYAVWKNVVTTTPVPNRTTTGTYTFTLPVNVSDEYDASIGITGNQPVQLFMAQGNVEGSTFGHLQCSANANVITVYNFNSSGNLADSTAIISIVGY